MGKKGLILLQLGGAADGDDIFSFTYNLLSDPKVIRLPDAVRKPLAFFIATVRNRRSRKRYKQINGSPIMAITEHQALELQKELDSKGMDIRVMFAARHSEPSIESIADRITGLDSCLLLPLFPHYSLTTVKTCVDKSINVLTAINPNIKIGTVEGFCDHPSYINAQASLINETIKNISRPRAVLFSAHSLPKAHIAAGDPYPKQVVRTMELVSKQIPHDCETFLGYQSQLSKKTWIGPSTPDVMRRIILNGTRNLIIVPIAFVSEHFETLYELDIDYAKQAKKLGFDVFKRVPALNTYQPFIKALADIAGQAILEQDL